MNAEQRVLIIDSDLKNCKAIKYALTEYGIGAYYTLSVIDGTLVSQVRATSEQVVIHWKL